MKTINIQFQQNIVEDLNKNYLNKIKESYKSRTLEILENPKITFSEFTDEQSDATDLSRIFNKKSGSMLFEQLTMLGLHNKANYEKNKAVNKTNFIGAPNLEPKILGGIL